MEKGREEMRKEENKNWERVFIASQRVAISLLVEIEKKKIRKSLGDYSEP